MNEQVNNAIGGYEDTVNQVKVDPVREAFERAIYNHDGNAPPLHENDFYAGYQAALANLPRVTVEELADFIWNRSDGTYRSSRETAQSLRAKFPQWIME